MPNTEITNDKIYKILTRLFTWSEVEIRIGSQNRDKTKALPLVYFDARAVRDRLDEAFGFNGWDEFHEPYIGVGKMNGDKCRLVCRMPDGAVVIREEVCDPSDIEALKGAVSGSLKRAFSALANRSLYEIEMPWVDTETSPNGTSVRFAKSAYAVCQAAYEKQCDELIKSGRYS